MRRFPVLLLLAACASSSSRSGRVEQPAVAAGDDLAEPYVKLWLALGVHDPLAVDAYYGPAEWKAEAEAKKAPLAEVRAGAEALLARARALPAAGDSLEALRARFFTTHLEALVTRIDIAGGKKLPFDEESRLLYNAVAPRFEDASFAETLARLEKMVPGTGPLPARIETLRRSMAIPNARLDAVFTAAIAECRRRTTPHVRLPEGESFSVEYVKNQPWGAYNWYKGDFRSVIQVNTDLPIYIDRAIDLACHEGYPGHHVFNALLEKELVRGRGFRELTLYPLFSPMSLIAEGSANFGVKMAFPGDERVAFERAVLFPLAGLDPKAAEGYASVIELVSTLDDRVKTEAARRYLDGQMDAAAAAAYMTRYGLIEPERAKKHVSFIETFRSYSLNYSVGQELVEAYVDRLAGSDRPRRWDVFRLLLTTPRLAGDLK
jgi:hypothetical protein